jgi:hypothetical protein
MLITLNVPDAFVARLDELRAARRVTTKPSTGVRELTQQERAKACSLIATKGLAFANNWIAETTGYKKAGHAGSGAGRPKDPGSRTQALLWLAQRAMDQIEADGGIDTVLAAEAKAADKKEAKK